MNQQEYQTMAALESEHWWYRGLRDFLQTSVLPRVKPQSSPYNVLDAGCGTGENLKLLSEHLDTDYLGGFDFSEDALQFATAKTDCTDLYQSDICQPALHCDELDLIISMDVIYVPGAAATLNGLKSCVKNLKPGGLFAFNLPAYQWLYSEHDVAVHTTQRFVKKDIVQLFSDIGLTPELISYRVSILFPVILAARLPSIIKKPTIHEATSDVTLPSPWINSILEKTLYLENRAIAQGARLPFGASISAIGRKP